ncbi:hypothetical protein O3G_MSEX012230, partial [Manduca sexta]
GTAANIFKTYVNICEMADPLVCNINFYWYIRFFFGFYHEFLDVSSKPVRWLAKCYCCLICVSVIFFYLYIPSDGFYSKYLLYLITTEYFIYVTISFLNTNKSLLQYYKKMPLIDASPSTYKPMRVCLVGYLCIMFFIRLSGFIKVLILHGEYNLQQIYFNFIDFIMWLVVLLGRSPLLFMFALLYTRVRLMRQTLENNNFDCRNLGKHHPRWYIQMYETIIDMLEEDNDTVKLQYYFYMYIRRLDLCVDERDREEIQKLFLFLKRNPFEYSLWRVVPLNVRSLLSLLSFTVTTSIAIMQIHGWIA